DQLGEVRSLAKQAGITPTFTKVRPDAPELLAMRGERAEYVKPAPEAPVTVKPAAPHRRRRASGSGTGRPAGSGSGRTGAPSRGRRSR
ncbi:MAG: ATP-dependent helicase, partial [Actinomycetes bacterium]